MSGTKAIQQTSNKMATKVDYGGRLLLLGLLIFFFVQVIFSANKLWQEKTAVSITKHYDHSRFMPSFGFCFKYRKAILDTKLRQAISTNGTRALAEATLNDARQVLNSSLGYHGGFFFNLPFHLSPPLFQET